MKTKFLIAILVSLAIISVVSAGMFIPANEKAIENARAAENSPVIDETEAGWELERIDLIHYVKPSNPGSSAAVVTCYKLLGVKWKSLPVSYVINPSNPQGLSEEFITSAISASAETWDAATTKELFNGYTVDYNLQYGTQDFNNVISFGNYPQEGVIGITTIWYIPRGKKIVEFDILLDTDFVWGDATINNETMDLQNIAIHELGHGAGLGDVYSSSCTEVTMYGYSTEGEIKKRTLETPDITGIKRLYG